MTGKVFAVLIDRQFFGLTAVALDERLERREATLSKILTTVDVAPPVDTSRIAPRALDDIRPGGLGSHFIRECMDASEFRTPPQGAGNRLWMEKKIA